MLGYRSRPDMLFADAENNNDKYKRIKATNGINILYLLWVPSSFRYIQRNNIGRTMGVPFAANAKTNVITDARYKNILHSLRYFRKNIREARENSVDSKSTLYDDQRMASEAAKVEAKIKLLTNDRRSFSEYSLMK